MTAAVDWCADYGLHFCNVNGPAPSNEKEYKEKYPTQSRKIYADIYVDDHNIEFVSRSVTNELSISIVADKLQRGVNTWERES